MSLGKVVRRRRKALGMSVERLAEKARLSPNYLGLLEREANRNPSLDTIRALARALGLSLPELLGDGQAMSAGALEAAKLFDALGETEQDLVLRLLRTLARKRTAKS